MCHEIFLQQQKDDLVVRIPGEITTGGKFPGVKVCFILMMLLALSALISHRQDCGSASAVELLRGTVQESTVPRTQSEKSSSEK